VWVAMPYQKSMLSLHSVMSSPEQSARSPSFRRNILLDIRRRPAAVRAADSQPHHGYRESRRVHPCKGTVTACCQLHTMIMAACTALLRCAMDSRASAHHTSTVAAQLCLLEHTENFAYE